MNDEYPTQPTEVLPEQDGTRSHDDPGAANGIVGAMSGPNVSERGEAAQPAEQSAIDTSAMSIATHAEDQDVGGMATHVEDADMAATPVSERDEPSDTRALGMSESEGEAAIPELGQDMQDMQDMGGISGMAPM